jgi:hypothetical protein
MTLLAIQRDFRAALLADADDAVSRFGDEGAAPGLAVYHNAYRAQLVECLQETFEQLHAWLGDHAFHRAAMAHIAENPPHGWTLGVYGEGFDTTLARLYPNNPEVRELAWLEWALSIAFTGPDALPVTPETLATVDWDDARLEFTPTLRIGETTTNVGAIWSALSAQETPPAAERLPAPAALLIWRHDFSPSFRTIEEAELAALTEALSGATFGELCSAQVSHWGADEGVSRAGMLLGQWLHDGLIIRVREREKP